MILKYRILTIYKVVFKNHKSLEKSDQTSTLEEHMNSVRNALNEIKVLIPKKLVEEVTDAANNRVYEFLTDEWSGTKENSDTKFMLKIEDIRLGFLVYISLELNIHAE